MRERLRSFAADENGATAIEYGIAVVLISVVVVAAMTWLGGRMTEVFEFLAAGFE